MKKIFLFTLLLLSTFLLHSQSPYSNYNYWITDESVTDMISDSNFNYISGEFNYIGPPTGSFANVTTSAISPNLNFIRANGIPYKIISDNYGGWYISGIFRQIETDSIHNYTNIFRLIHVFSNGILDTTWKPQIDDTPSDMILSGTDLYLCGNFRNVGGLTRYGLAKVRTYGIGNVDSLWNPSTYSGTTGIGTMVLYNNYIYLGGYFSNISGLTRVKLAKVSALGTGSIDSTWAPSADRMVYTMVVIDSNIYIGGSFNYINGKSINYLAKLKTNGIGLVDTFWNPNPYDEVYQLTYDSTYIYVGGKFNVISGIIRSKVARISPYLWGKADTTWNPNPNGNVGEITVSSDAVFLGGSFTSMGGKSRNYIAKVSKSGGGLVDSSWVSNADKVVNCIAINGNNLLIGGGGMTSVGGLMRKGIARIHNTGNKVCDTLWDPKLTTVTSSGQIFLAKSDSFLYINGDISSVGGITRYLKICRVKVTGTGLIDTTWNPNITGNVTRVFLSDTNVYLCGDMPSIDGINRSRLLRVSTNGIGLIDSLWNPILNNIPLSVLITDSLVYIGGYFTTIRGKNHNRIARIYKYGIGEADSTWNPSINDMANNLILDSNQLFISGYFTNVNGHSIIHVAKISTQNNGALDSTWNLHLTNSSELRCIFLHDKYLYIGGYILNVNGHVRDNLIKVKKDGIGQLDYYWHPILYSIPHAITRVNDKIYAAGVFTTANYQFRQHIAEFGFNNDFCIDSFRLNENICIGNNYFFNDSNLTTGGVYKAAFISSLQCDSIVILNLEILPNAFSNISDTICKDSSYFFNGIYLDTSGIYTDTLVNYLNCDSFIILNLNVFDCSNTSIQGINSNNLNFHTYPNPAKNQLTIEFGSILNNNENIDVVLNNILGNKCFQKSFKFSNSIPNQTIDIEKLESGIYILSIYIDDVLSKQQKIIINK